jgi:hypothetical protein
MWGLSSRALRDDPIGSRFGGVRPASGSYANHPPLIIGETAIAETIAGEHRVATRSPAWLGSIVALILLCWLLLDAGLSPTAVAAGVVTTCGSAMFLVYGTMLDTPVTSLPFALAVLLAWQRARQGRPWPAAVLVALGVLAGLAGWQCFAFAAIAVATLALDSVRRRRSWGPTLALGAGAILGLVTTLVWIHWVYGSFTPLLHQRTYRSDGSPLLGSARIQLSILWALMPMAMIIGSVGAFIAARDTRVRALLAISTASVIGYALAFRGAAEIHDYWNYAALIPLAVGASAGFDRLTSSAAASRHTLFRFGSLAVAATCLIIALTQPSDAQDRIEAGLVPLRLAHIARDLPHDDAALAYFAPGDRSFWIEYETGAPALALSSVDDLQRLAEANPNFPVLLGYTEMTADQRANVTGNAFAIEGSYALVPASVVARATSTPQKTGR